MYHILNFVLYFAEMLIVYTYISDIFEKKYSTIKTILIGTGIFAVPFIINELWNQVIVNISVFALTVFCFYLICYRSGVWQCVIHSVIVTAAMTVTELICLYSVSLFFGELTFYSYKNSFSIYVLDVITSKLLFLFVCKIISRFKAKDRSKSLKIPISYYFYAFASFGLVFSMLVINKNFNFPAKIQIVVIASSVLLLFSLIFIFISYESAMEKNVKYIQLQNEMKAIEVDRQYYKVLQSKNDEMHQLTHDMKHHFSTIQMLPDKKEINDYIEKISHKLDVYTVIGKTDNKLLDLILNKYVAMCDANKVSFTVNAKTANLSELASDDLSSLLNNILDNALESAKKVENGQIFLSIKKTQTFTVLTCSNSCDKEPEIKNGNFVSTKTGDNADMHGYGTKNIKRIVKEYSGDFQWDYSEENKLFTVTIII